MMHPIRATLLAAVALVPLLGAAVPAAHASGGIWSCSTNQTGDSHCTTSTMLPMPTARKALATAKGANGIIYTFGGYDSAGNHSDLVEAYNPTTNLWSCSTNDTAMTCATKTLTPMPTGRAFLSATLGPDGLIYVIGGYGDPTQQIVEAYDPTANTWTCSAKDPDTSNRCTAKNIPAMPTGRHDLMLATDGKSVYAIGGAFVSGSATQFVESYTPASNGWDCSVGDDAATCPSHTLAIMPTTRWGAAIGVINGIIYVAGGWDTNQAAPVMTLESYKPGDASWACSTGDAEVGCSSVNLAPVPSQRTDVAGAVGPDGKLYDIGGYDAYGNTLANVEAYNPADNSWECTQGGSDPRCKSNDIPPLPTARDALAAADGPVYVLGGENASGQPQNDVDGYTPAAGPTLATVRHVGAVWHGRTVTVRWSAAFRPDVAGFALYSGAHRLNTHLIVQHHSPRYIYTVQAWPRLTLTLHIVFADGYQATVGPIR